MLARVDVIIPKCCTHLQSCASIWCSV